MDSLAAELTQNIISFLDKTDLPALARCAKRYAEITRAHIFESVRWHCKTEYVHVPQQLDRFPTTEFKSTPPRRLGCLLRSLLENPELGTLIKRLELGTPFTIPDIRRPDDMMGNRLPILDSVSIDEDVVERLGSSYHALWGIRSPALVEAFRRGSVDACCAMLLALSPNVEDLELGECVVNRSRLIGNALGALRIPDSEASEFALTKLRRVTLCRHISYYWSDLLEVPFNLILPLLTLPSIQEISVVLPEPDYYVSSNLGPMIHQQNLPRYIVSQPVLSTLTVLRLRHSSLRPDILHSIIELCTSLCVFEYGLSLNFAARRWGTEENYAFNAGQITSALRPVAAQLQELRLSIRRAVTDAPNLIFPMEDWAKLEGCLGSLKDFVTLRILEAPIALLLGYDPATAPKLHDILPPSVTSLSLRDDLSHFADLPWTRTTNNEPYISGEMSAEPVFATLKALADAKHAGATCVTELNLLLTSLYDAEDWGFPDLEMDSVGGLLSRADIQYTVMVYVHATSTERQYQRRYSYKHDMSMDKECYTCSYDVDPDFRSLWATEAALQDE